MGSNTVNRVLQPNSYSNICFFISPIGEENSIYRSHSDAIMENLVVPVCNKLKLKVVRGDMIDKPGVVTEQVKKYLRRSKFCIADLSFLNPNVLFELGYRKGRSMPCVQLKRKKDKIPFDLADTRMIIIDVSNPYIAISNMRSAIPYLESQLRGLSCNKKINPLKSHY